MQNNSPQSDSTAKPVSSLGKIKQKEKHAKEKIKKAQNCANDLISQTKIKAGQTVKQATQLTDDEMNVIINQALLPSVWVNI